MNEFNEGRVLSCTEEQVLALLAEDYTNVEIAERLVCSPETVKTHVSHILSKLGLANRREAARWWREKITRDGGCAYGPQTASLFGGGSTCSLDRAKLRSLYRSHCSQSF